MNIRDILNRLTEEELELLQDEIDGDLYDEIERAIEDKNQPTLFAQKFKVGDVFLYKSNKNSYLYRINRASNPYFDCQCLCHHGAETIPYLATSEVKASELMKYKQLDSEIWDRLKSAYDSHKNKIKNLELSYRRLFDRVIGEEEVIMELRAGREI